MSFRVLIVEDDPEFSEALQGVLRDAGFSVRVAPDGKQALDILNREHESIDAAIVDLNVPDVSGFEVIGAITRRKTMIGVLATTRAYKDTFLDVARYIGANVAMRKPDDLKDLTAWVPIIRSIVQAEDQIGNAFGAVP